MSMIFAIKLMFRPKTVVPSFTYRDYWTLFGLDVQRIIIEYVIIAESLELDAMDKKLDDNRFTYDKDGLLHNNERWWMDLYWEYNRLDKLYQSVYWDRLSMVDEIGKISRTVRRKHRDYWNKPYDYCVQPPITYFFNKRKKV
jgi:hypothetical protein